MHMGKTGRRLGLLLHRSQIEAKEPPDDLIVVQRGQPSGQAGGAGGVNRGCHSPAEPVTIGGLVKPCIDMQRLLRDPPA